MNWNLFWIFVVLNVVNVIIQTVKSIATIKCGKVSAAVINAVAYGLYTIVLVYTVCDLNLWLKAGVVAVANLVGVFVVKTIEEKARRDKLWEVRATVKGGDDAIALYKDLIPTKISFNHFVTTNGDVIYNIYCPTQKESTVVKYILAKHNAKYFVSESKTL